MRIHFLSVPLLLTAIACGSAQEEERESPRQGSTPDASATMDADTLACSFRGSAASLSERLSPPDSAVLTLDDGGHAKLCYGAPSTRGREMIGGEHVPYGELWRTGANEPTTLHLGFAAEVAGIRVEPGSYSLYTRPGEEEWTLHLSRSVDRWGIPIGDDVRAEEVGDATLDPEPTPEEVETLRFRFQPADGRSAELVMEWEGVRLRIPVEMVSSP